MNLGNYPKALQTSLSSLTIAEDPQIERNHVPEKYLDIEEYKGHTVTPHILRLHMLGKVHLFTGIVYGNANNYEKEKYHYLQAKHFFEQIQNNYELSTVLMTLGRVYLSLKKTDSALLNEQNSYDLAIKIGFKKYLGSILLNLARIQLARGNNQLAVEYFKEAITVSEQQNYLRGVVAGNLALADISKKDGRLDSGLHYVNTALHVADNLKSPNLLLRCYTALATIYRAFNNKDSTVKYQELIIKMNDSLFNLKQAQQFQNIDFDEQQRQQEIAAEKKAYRNRLLMYGLLIGLVIIFLVAIILWRNNQHRKKANALLSQQKNKISTTLTELKSTQAQLIQSEKMASLGELTAGIAHEIQNPLNFVNNFSEVNKELIGEMKVEIEKGNYDEVKTIAKDIEDNEEKINHHGKRADAIVKGMLQHSRSSSSVKEPTDINALADEYLRLCYHGLRAKDKSFSATIKTDFDNSIGKINIIPQDIGRVLLNLFTNAFYAVTEKKKQLQQNNYEPIVSVSIKKIDSNVEIRVRDNGMGISQKLLDKIFQPFFTTKPTGQGTGLGLSMSYDIIKAHGGEIKVETKEKEGSEFIIQLPVMFNK
jgi:signal transduction histidine kinase